MRCPVFRAKPALTVLLVARVLIVVRHLVEINRGHFLPQGENTRNGSAPSGSSAIELSKVEVR
jgi:hypothetical protein